MFKQLSKQYDDLYQQHLESFQQKLVATFPIITHYTDFFPSIGVPKGGSVDFLMYGQSIGGWQKELDYSKSVPKDRVAQSKAYSNGQYRNDSPLDWVNVMWSKYGKDRWEGQRSMYIESFGSYNPSRSFFWKVITRTIAKQCQLQDSDWSWTEKLVWSNLYKIAPQFGSHKPNPSEADRILQRPEAVHLVRMELEELQPKYCVVITNDLWWSHFRKGLGSKVLETPKRSVIESVEQYGSTRIVVTKRPFVGSSDTFVKAICEYLPSASKKVLA